jgi:hypothetical protein
MAVAVAGVSKPRSLAERHISLALPTDETPTTVDLQTTSTLVAGELRCTSLP